MKFVAQKPQLTTEEGVLKVSAAVGADTDGDGVHSAGVKLEVFVDGKEAVKELIKNGLPSWLKKMIGTKATAEDIIEVQEYTKETM